MSSLLRIHCKVFPVSTNLHTAFVLTFFPFSTSLLFFFSIYRNKKCVVIVLCCYD